jgi:hypothetical protein
MNIHCSGLMRLPLLLALILGAATAQALPEIPFCPLGGPTGWWNRMTDDDDRYYPPPYYPPPLPAPYWNQVHPYSYAPQYPLHPGYPRR